MNWDSDPTAHMDLSQDAWQVLLDTASHFTAQLIDTEKVEACLQEVRMQLGNTVFKAVTSLENLARPQDPA